MGTTSRRGFLKGLGATLSAIGAASATSVGDTVQAGTVLRQIGSTPGSHTAQVYGGRMGRGVIARHALEMLVAERLAEWVATGQTFTAYDVTLALRAAHPAINIFHQDVRSVVHHRMWPVVARQIYLQEQVLFPTGSACCYRPV